MSEPRRSSSDSSGTGRERLASRIALLVALMGGFLSLLQPEGESGGLFLLYGLSCAAGLLPRQWGWKTSLLRIGLLAASALTARHLVDWRDTPGESAWLDQASLAVLLAGLVAPLCRCRSDRDLTGFSLLVLCLFFFSAAFLRSEMFLPALTVAVPALLFAFYASRAGGPTPQAERWRSSWRLVRAHVLIIAVVGTVVFLGFPRSAFTDSSGPLKFLVQEGLQSSGGFSQSLEMGMDSRRDQLQLTNLHELARSENEVLQVRFMNPTNGAPVIPDRPTYLRANLYDTYRSEGWSSSQRLQLLDDSFDGRTDGWVRIATPVPDELRPLIRQKIRIKPMGDLCFSLPDPIAINVPRMKTLAGACLIFPWQQRVERDYDVISQLPPLGEDSSLGEAKAATDEPELRPYLRLPRGLARRLREWSSQIDSSLNPWERADRIRRSLETGYRYNLGAFMPPEGTDPIDYFLFQRKEGYCTHFASAMALLCRVHGLPSRVATGFHFQNTTEPGGTNIVRDHHAHAWTEVHFPGRGWVIFDATPAVFRPPYTNHTEGTGFAALQILRRLDDYLSSFDSTAQAALLRGAAQLPVTLLGQAAALLKSPLGWGGLAAFGAALWAAWRSLPARQHRRIRRFLTRAPRYSDVDFYDDFLWILTRAGIAKSAAMTGWEFAALAEQRLPGEEIQKLTANFYRVRYAGQSLSDAEQLRTESLLQQLTRRLAETPPSPSPKRGAG